VDILTKTPNLTIPTLAGFQLNIGLCSIFRFLKIWNVIETRVVFLNQMKLRLINAAILA
jgi:hypothetical protein